MNFRTHKLVFDEEIREDYHKVHVIEANDIISELEDGISQLYVSGSSKVTSVVSLNDLSSFIKLYSEYDKVFDQKMAENLAQYGPQNLTITLLESKELLFSPLYNLSETELTVLREYLNTYCKRN